MICFTNEKEYANLRKKIVGLKKPVRNYELIRYFEVDGGHVESPAIYVICVKKSDGHIFEFRRLYFPCVTQQGGSNYDLLDQMSLRTFDVENDEIVSDYGKISLDLTNSELKDYKETSNWEN